MNESLHRLIARATLGPGMSPVAVLVAEPGIP